MLTLTDSPKGWHNGTVTAPNVFIAHKVQQEPALLFRLPVSFPESSQIYRNAFRIFMPFRLKISSVERHVTRRNNTISSLYTPAGYLGQSFF
jgi:hypothetical protein